MQGEIGSLEEFATVKSQEKLFYCLAFFGFCVCKSLICLLTYLFYKVTSFLSCFMPNTDASSRLKAPANRSHPRRSSCVIRPTPTLQIIHLATSLRRAWSRPARRGAQHDTDPPFQGSDPGQGQGSQGHGDAARCLPHTRTFFKSIRGNV